ncbi:tRNA pseudouridine32 synthase/23S rRNA pseudouridine746 synthase [Simiduia aestuariiviva]|uniref:tRNA pseudouridine32 synthase/23S rRNA pseudouridine746 synthase n=1 Tax=Simiduia aestuariiviva TaxID=1510459 RepID=A0A839ULV8_9GAMM|nr:tRNA pseudouridine32 synthase/23S rRNA pseudouridine746 synthase [Simiduia aestuariiviva]
MMRFQYRPPAGLPDTIFCDDELLVVNKPSGLLSNPGIDPITHDCALSRLEQQYGALFLIHRLDCDTSGLLTLARTKAAERSLKIQWQERQVRKRYQALVWGQPSPPAGHIHTPLAPNKDRVPLWRPDPHGKQAHTEYEVLDTAVGHSRLALTPSTGRTHQLRVHMLSLGHPILGDRFYGNEAVQAAAPRLCLHADRLSLVHPNGEQLHLECPPEF